MAKKPRPFVGPDRAPKRGRSIFCRTCLQDVSFRVDGTWRHDHDGSILVRHADGSGCIDPDTLWAEADAQTAAREARGELAPINPGRYDHVDDIVGDTTPDSQGGTH